VLDYIFCNLIYYWTTQRACLTWKFIFDCTRAQSLLQAYRCTVPGTLHQGVGQCMGN